MTLARRLAATSHCGGRGLRRVYVRECAVGPPSDGLVGSAVRVAGQLGGVRVLVGAAVFKADETE